MTQNGNLKRRVRARAAKTGESYTAALSHIRKTSPDRPEPYANPLRLAVAQTTLFDDPGNISGLRAGGKEMRRLMREAHRAGAQLVHFPEGTICSPGKRIMSSTGPREIGPSDWSRFEWATQIADVEHAAQALRELIATLDAAMNERFAATFSAVAEEFSATFARLFGGGTAQLLLNEDNHGIEIVAQPPGKRRQALSLLSGGERSLTAVALLVALLRVNPTPFCVMDEVDAALDEANVVRFREVLREMSERTQFIIVTHNRGTVEVAGTLYGVTMQTDGASKILSLQMDDLVETEAGAITYVSTNL